MCVWVAGLQGLQKVTWVAFFFNQNPYTICSGVMNSEGCVFGLQGYKGYKRLHGLYFFFISESIYYMQWSDEF